MEWKYIWICHLKEQNAVDLLPREQRTNIVQNDATTSCAEILWFDDPFIAYLELLKMYRLTNYHVLAS